MIMTLHQTRPAGYRSVDARFTRETEVVAEMAERFSLLTAEKENPFFQDIFLHSPGQCITNAMKTFARALIFVTLAYSHKNEAQGQPCP